GGRGRWGAFAEVVRRRRTTNPRPLAGPRGGSGSVRRPAPQRIRPALGPFAGRALSNDAPADIETFLGIAARGQPRRQLYPPAIVGPDRLAIGEAHGGNSVTPQAAG